MPKASSNPTQRPRKRAPQPQAPAPRSPRDTVERVLAFLVVAFAVIAVLGFAGSMLHVGLRDSVELFAGVAWQYAYWLPLIALPLAIVCLVTLVIVSAAGKARGR
ncbi:hypothetical protein L332_06135 [Agrococcus pavilionensis RW1]|uniref:Multidrug ABC transporter ATPase n=1 Tax=Agrococcus pavilionensis RW1 TaxID=1330458 RepID=U1MQ20_9MICO|nr:hypothetical protein [Agrococcus pavilionensis]ERG64036.1 hypothetical protein L332_06135 [Agrococcus pavilionensis RW1]